jgi:hypothetical protein
MTTNLTIVYLCVAPSPYISTSHPPWGPQGACMVQDIVFYVNNLAFFLFVT